MQASFLIGAPDKNWKYSVAGMCENFRWFLWHISKLLISSSEIQ